MRVCSLGFRAVIALSSIFTFSVLCAAGQPAPAAAAQAIHGTVDGSKSAADFSKEPYVVLKSVARVVFAADGTGTRDYEFAVRVQSDAAVRNFGVLTFSYEGDNESVQIGYVRVRKPDGTVITSPDVIDMPSNVSRAAPLYSDLKEKQAPVKALSVGDTLEYLVHYRMTKPEVPGEFWFTYTFPKQGIVLDETLEIDVPAAKQVKVLTPDVQPTITQQGSKKIYVWKTAQLEPTKPTDPTKAQSQEPKPPSVQLTTFQNWQQIGAWYLSLQQPQPQVTPAIHAKAEELTKGLNTEDEKLHAIYNYVSTQVRYIGLDFGIGRYQPHRADDVLSDEYGDCKDKHTLFAALLKAVGIEAWPVLIGSQAKLDADFPSPGQFDHVITVIPQGGKYIWLDTTPEVAPFAMLSAVLRDKEALVIPLQGPALLAKTPAEPPFPGEETFTAVGKLSADGVLTGQLSLSLRGDAELAFRSIFRQVPAVQWQNAVQRLSYAMGFGGLVSNVQGGDPTDTSHPFHYSYDYTRKDYSDWQNHRIGPPLPYIRFQYTEQDPKPVDPLKLGEIGKVTYRATVQLPPGYSMQPPADVNVVADFAEYHATYSVKNGVFTTERSFLAKKSEVPLSEWEAYLKLEKAAVNDQDTTISLIHSDAVAPASGANGTKANDLLQQADTLITEGRFAAAKVLLMQIKLLNPHLLNLNSTFARFYIKQNRMGDAVPYLQKEIKEHPDNPGAYRMLGIIYDLQQKREDGIAIWRKLLQLIPEDTGAETQLAAQLLNTKQYQEALALFTKLAQRQPGDSNIAIMYGGALLATGKPQQAVAVVEKAADRSGTSPIILTGIARLLVRARADLPRARGYAQRAVTAMEDQTSQLSLHPIPDHLPDLMLQLADGWDTLGWIDFQLGDSVTAEKYIRSGWMLAQTPQEADHLGQVYERQGNKKEAAHLYLLAIAAAQSHDWGFDVVPTRGRFMKLTGERAGGRSARQSVDFSHSTEAAEELSRMRSIDFVGKKEKGESADFYVLFSAGVPRDAKLNHGPDDMGRYRPALLNAKYDLPVPDQGPEKIIRHGSLFCSEAGDCQFAMTVP